MRGVGVGGFGETVLWGSNFIEIQGHHCFHGRTNPFRWERPLGKAHNFLLSAEVSHRPVPELVRLRERVPRAPEASSRGRASAELSLSGARSARRQGRAPWRGTPPARPAGRPGHGLPALGRPGAGPVHRVSHPGAGFRGCSPPALARTRGSSQGGRSESSTSTCNSGRARGAKAQVRLHTTTPDELPPLRAPLACAGQLQTRPVRPRSLGSSSGRRPGLASDALGPEDTWAQAGARRRRVTWEPEQGEGSDPDPKTLDPSRMCQV